VQLGHKRATRLRMLLDEVLIDERKAGT